MRTASPMARCALLLAAGLAAACDFGERSVGAGREHVAVHGVLNPGQYMQTVLVERTLTGAAAPEVGTFDPDDPIVSAGGLPISDAVVVILGPGGDSAIAREDLATRGDGRGAGVYRFFDADSVLGGPMDDAIPLVPGATYQLRVTTPDGRTVTGTTTIPAGPSVITAPQAEQFNRDHDSLFVFWPEADAARYAVRIETPHGPFETYVDSAEYLVSGALRHTGLRDLPRVFVPGFRQRITIGAVDANYFDYFRSASSPYTGRGLIMHLDGGVGVFGSWISLLTRTPVVTADIDEPIEGQWLALSPGANQPRGFVLYVDSRDRAWARLSGSWALASQPSAGVLGAIANDRVTLAFLRGQTSADTVYTLDGTFAGRTIEGTIRQTGARVAFQLQ